MIAARGWLVVALSVAVLITVCARARAADAPRIDCEAVRYYVAIHGQVAALAWAVRRGFSLSEIREAKRCLK